jgi:Flp pilus assembly protein TadG
MTGLRCERLEDVAERGFVTAETAMVMPTLIGLGLALVLIVTAAATQLRCADAAWEAARGLARGEPADYANQVVSRLGPPDASVAVETNDGSVLVRVSAQLALAGALLPVIHVEGRARITCEPGTRCAKTAIGQGAH